MLREDESKDVVLWKKRPSKLRFAGMIFVVVAAAGFAFGNEKVLLFVSLPRPMNGDIIVKNIGDSISGPTKLILDCVKTTTSTGAGSCPNLPVSVAPSYFDPQYPKYATISVPALKPGQIFTHRLSFWRELVFTRGTYQFTAVVDPGNALSKGPGSKNVATSTFVVP